MKAIVYVVIHATLIVACLTVAPVMQVCSAQTTYIDQMVLDHMNQRRFEERLRDRRTAEKKRTTKAPTKKSKTTTARRSLGVVELSRDLYNQGREEAAWTLEVTLTPEQNGKKIVRRFTMSKDQGASRLTDVPMGRYLLTARAIAADGTAQPAFVGKETHSSPTEPQKHGLGNSINIELTASNSSSAAPPRAHAWFAR